MACKKTGIVNSRRRTLLGYSTVNIISAQQQATWEAVFSVGSSLRLKEERKLGLAEFPCGGGLELLHHSPASLKRRRKWNPVPGGITGLPFSWGI
jgi:hypothetical protein